MPVDGTLEACNSIAVGVTHGSCDKRSIDPERVGFELFDPFRVGFAAASRPWAMPTAIQFHAFSVKPAVNSAAAARLVGANTICDFLPGPLSGRRRAIDLL